MGSTGGSGGLFARPEIPGVGVLEVRGGTVTGFFFELEGPGASGSVFSLSESEDEESL